MQTFISEIIFACTSGRQAQASAEVHCLHVYVTQQGHLRPGMTVVGHESML